MKPFTYITCKNCGWIHMGVAREYATSQVFDFNEYYYELPQDRQNAYGRAASVSDYEACVNCGHSYKNSTETTDEEIDNIRGSTINPMLLPTE